MRSYSSLISHILGSHPDISGHSELQQSYLKNSDFIKANFKTYLNSTKYSGIVFDKILNNHFRIHPDFYKNIIFIICIREPISSINSLFKLYKYELKYKNFNMGMLVDYYVNRLNYLSEISNSEDLKYMFLKAENIILDTDKTLQNISEFLDLNSDLKSEYQMFNNTGSKGAGDPSKKIKSGYIDSDKEEKIEITLDNKTEESLNKEYNRTLEILKSNSDV